MPQLDPLGMSISRCSYWLAEYLAAFSEDMTDGTPATVLGGWMPSLLTIPSAGVFWIMAIYHDLSINLSINLKFP